MTLIPLIVFALLAGGISIGYFIGVKTAEVEVTESLFVTRLEKEGWRVGFLLRDGQTRITGEMTLREALLRIREEKAGAYLAKLVSVVWKDEIPSAETIIDQVENELEKALRPD